MIDLNSNKYNTKPVISKLEILATYSEYYIYSYYLGGNPVVGQFYTSPWRPSEETPSFKLYESVDGLWFRDFGGKGDSGDVIQFVNTLFSLNSYYDAIVKIYEDLQMHDSLGKNMLNTQTLSYKKKKRSRIGAKCKPWSTYDLAFWDMFGITPKTLKKFKVVPISHIFIDGRGKPSDRKSVV